MTVSLILSQPENTGLLELGPSTILDWQKRFLNDKLSNQIGQEKVDRVSGNLLD